ncbi:maternal B9.15 protein [Monomorium pharaonis]|uniref:maternal B9.15 protein n=1 Tax=Monomorium pharaonis TaxID=307658 RepID=UPI00063F20DD|nr:maternal B9.15 protein [Monomorium pharaonis]XP_012543086.1 maternal B9.15 protein [Monomorium pharaonis]XP_012543087.1 maternal B9.15 protein [Monomorium pharaonis]
MLNEIRAAVLFLVNLIEKSEKFSPDQLECFERHLVKLLTERFKNHWFPDKPFKGQGYRCIRVNGHNRRDATLESAANAAGVKYEDLALPVELTLWVDPNEVCCRFGESKGSYCTLASFDDKENTVPIFQFTEHHESTENENKPTPVGSIKIQKSLLTTSTEQQPKSKPLSTANQNQQHSNNGAGKRRNLNSPRLHLNRNRSWFGHSFNMGYGPHPIGQPWYNIMPPHFLGGPSPPPFVGHRGNKWVHQPSYPAGPARFHHWSPKAALKV